MVTGKPLRWVTNRLSEVNLEDSYQGGVMETLIGNKGGVSPAPTAQELLQGYRRRVEAAIVVILAYSLSI